MVLKLGYQTMIHNDNEHNNYNEQELSIIDSNNWITPLLTELSICVLLMD